MAKVLEDQTFALKTGEFTEPIRTRQGYVIFKYPAHAGRHSPFKDVQDQVADAYYMTRMEPAIRDYLTQMRNDAYIDIKPGYTDTGASPSRPSPSTVPTRRPRLRRKPRWSGPASVKPRARSGKRVAIGRRSPPRQRLPA